MTTSTLDLADVLKDPTSDIYRQFQRHLLERGAMNLIQFFSLSVKLLKIVQGNVKNFTQPPKSFVVQAKSLYDTFLSPNAINALPIDQIIKSDFEASLLDPGSNNIDAFFDTHSAIIVAQRGVFRLMNAKHFPTFQTGEAYQKALAEVLTTAAESASASTFLSMNQIALLKNLQFTGVDLANQLPAEYSLQILRFGSSAVNYCWDFFIDNLVNHSSREDISQLVAKTCTHPFVRRLLTAEALQYASLAILALLNNENYIEWNSILTNVGSACLSGIWGAKFTPFVNEPISVSIPSGYSLRWAGAAGSKPKGFSSRLSASPSNAPSGRRMSYAPSDTASHGRRRSMDSQTSGISSSTGQSTASVCDISAAQIQLIKTSWDAIITSHDHREVSALFYKHLYRFYPEAKTVFAHFAPDKRSRVIINIGSQIAQYCHNLPSMDIQRLGVIHAKIGVSLPAQFNAAGQAFYATFSNFYPEWTDEHTRSWEIAYEYIVARIIGYAQAYLSSLAVISLEEDSFEGPPFNPRVHEYMTKSMLSLIGTPVPKFLPESFVSSFYQTLYRRSPKTRKILAKYPAAGKGKILVSILNLCLQASKDWEIVQARCASLGVMHKNLGVKAEMMPHFAKSFFDICDKETDFTANQRKAWVAVFNAISREMMSTLKLAGARTNRAKAAHDVKGSNCKNH